jgi:hypothetical protein
MGVRMKLLTYSQGFARLLGITLESIDYLEGELHRAAREVPINSRLERYEYRAPSDHRK